MNKFWIRSSFVVGYMLLAISWWAVLLWKGYDKQFELEVKILELQQQTTTSELQLWPEYQKLKVINLRKKAMIIGEGVFFSLCMVLGLYIIRRTAQKEFSLARQRRNFLLSITHELKSPIAALRLVLETFQKRTLSKEQAEPLLDGGLQNATRLQNLVQDLLLAARLEDSWRPMHEPISLQQLVESCKEVLRVRFPKANLQCQLQENLPLLQADKSGMTSVLMNLLENAIKYSPEGAPVQLQISHQGTKFILQVADQGQGIPPEERTSIFDKFYRLGNEETRKATGTGLGLYIVKQVVEAHQGSIQLSDNHPNGTIFTIRL